MLLVSSDHILVLLLHLLMIVVVRLEDRGLVTCAAANAVVVAHDFAQLIEGLEDMDADASVEARRLQEPQVLRIVAALGQLVRRLDALLFRYLHLLQLRIYRFDIAFLELFDNLENLREGLDALTNVITQVVEHNRDRHRVVDVDALALVVSLQVQEQIVLRCEGTVTLHMVHKLLQAVLADEVVLDATRGRLPFEVVQTVVVVVSRLPARVQHAVTTAFAALCATAHLKDALDQLGVVAGSDDVLEWLRLILLISVLRDV